MYSIRQITTALGLALGLSGGCAGDQLGTTEGVVINPPAPTANLTLSRDGVYDFGTLNRGVSADLTITISHEGVPATLNPPALTAPFFYKGGAFPGSGGTCTTTIDADCTMVIQFMPLVAGEASAQASLNYTYGSATKDVSLALRGMGSAEGPIPAFCFTDADRGVCMLGFNFGEVSRFQVALQKLYLCNGGGPASQIEAPALAAPFGFDGDWPGRGGDCGSVLLNGACCSFVLRFSPTVVGPAQGRFNLRFNNGLMSTSEEFMVAGTGKN